MSRKLYDNYFEDLINLFPTMNDYLNIPKYSHLKKLYENDISEAHILLQKKIFNKYLKLLSKVKNKNHFDKILEYTINEYLSSYKYDFHLMPLNHTNNIISNFVEMASGNSVYEFNSAEDYNNFIIKTTYFTLWIDTSIENMKNGIIKKLVLSKLLCKLLINQLKNIVKTRSYINKKGTKLYNQSIEDLLKPKINQVIDFLDKDYYQYCIDKNGMSSLPNGKSMYRYLAESSITRKDLTIKKIHQLGLMECDRIRKEMIKVKDEHGYQGSLVQFNKYLKFLPELQYKSRKEVIDTYKKMQSKLNKFIMKKLFKKKISHDYLIEAVPKYNEKYAPSAYYVLGDLNKKRKGKFYINLGNLKTHNKIYVESLSLHEGNPGHHYQITYVNDSNLPLFIKIGSFTAYDEGWALYCENLGEYNDILSYYGKLNMEMLRALRLVIDTGIHYYEWSESRCLSFMKRYLFDDEKNILSEIHRYMANPGQALAYKIGELSIINLKKKYKGDIKNFHEEVLELGSIPLEILNKKLSN